MGNLETPLKKQRDLTNTDREIIFERLGSKYGTLENHYQVRNQLAAELGLTTMQVGVLAERQKRMQILNGMK